VSKPRGRKFGPPLPGSSVSLPPIDAGEPIYHTPVPPAKSVVRLKPAGQAVLVDAGEPLTPEQAKARRAELGIPDPDRPLVPTAAEVAALPGKARAAFAARCAKRVAPLAGSPAPAALDAAGAAGLMLAASTVASPVRAWLRRLRRDFDRLVFLAKRDEWTDDTPVPPDVFGPLWPKNRAPEWAKEPRAPEADPPSAPPAG
jgi:hypothetical protein